MKTLLITGAGRGIGAATALAASRIGYAVAVNYHRDRTAAETLCDTIREQGGTALPVQADVSREEEIIRLFDTVTAGLGPLTAFVNNAGILEPQTRVVDLTADRLHRMFAVNTIGPILCAREAIRRMSTTHGGPGGAIVNVSSVAARLGAPGEYIDYAASKGAIDTFTIGLSREVAAEGIRVNAVRPGYIHTTIHASGGEPHRVDRVKHSLPMQRGGTPEEVAAAILWLLSDAASYVTGTFIDLAGGR